MASPQRMTNPVYLNKAAFKALMELGKSVQTSLPENLIELINLRASQLNGCSVCTLDHYRQLKKMGQSDDWVHSVAAWRDAPFYSDAERAVLALTEQGTRLADSAGVCDEVWNEAVSHFSESDLAAIVLHIAQINAWNRINVMTRQEAGQAWA